MPTKVIVDCATNTSTTVELTAEEIAEMEHNQEIMLAELAKQEAEAQAKAEAKASALVKLQELGLSEDEVVALLG